MNNKEKILAPLTICHLVLTALAIVLSVIGLVTLLNLTEGPDVYPGKAARGTKCYHGHADTADAYPWFLSCRKTDTITTAIRIGTRYELQGGSESWGLIAKHAECL